MSLDTVPLAAAAHRTRTGDLWLFRGSTTADRLIQTNGGQHALAQAALREQGEHRPDAAMPQPDEDDDDQDRDPGSEEE